VHIKTYGCQMNVYDSGRMADILAGEGYEETDDPELADLVLLNTCHIREKAAEKVYSELGRLRQMKEARRSGGRDLQIGVAGCVAQAEGAEMRRRAPVVDFVVGPQAYHKLGDVVGALAAGTRGAVETEFPVEDKFDALPEMDRRRAIARGRTAFVTVQEGCDKFCTFCVVPYTRGAEYSRPLEAVEAEVRALAEGGVREVTLLGQNVNAYHGDDGTGGAASLAQLIERLGEIDGLERLRYTTSHPRDMDAALIEAHGANQKLMPYLHLPVQAGSDRVLKAMNRQHTAESYLAIIERLRATRPDIALSGDFIVGFPGETEADFQATLCLVRAVGYAQAYSFKYSQRPGTPAADDAVQVPEDEKSDRLQRLQALLNDQQLAFNRNCVGRTMPVLFDRRGRRPGQLIGRSPYLQSVHIDEAPEAMFGEIVDVQIEEAMPNSLKARLSGGHRQAEGCEPARRKAGAL